MKERRTGSRDTEASATVDARIEQVRGYPEVVERGKFEGGGRVDPLSIPFKSPLVAKSSCIRLVKGEQELVNGVK